MKEEKVKPVRYSYAVTSALLAGGAALSLLTGFPAGAQIAQNDGQTISSVVPRAGAPDSFADLTERLQPAVVNISTTQSIAVASRGNRGGPPATREAQSLGSGFIISADGYVVTNNHVLHPDGRATLEEVVVTTPDGTEYEATLVGYDALSDLAVLKISRSSPFPFVNFGASSETRPGDWVIAIGNPFGLGGTVTSGIISAVQRATGIGAYDRFLQTDASINSGNSGGPLFDMQGNVIGINNAIISPSGGSVGIGFAIPAETADPIVKQLIAGEAIERGFLGVGILPVSEDLAEALGIPENKGEFIRAVQPGQPAAEAGLKADDVVLKIDGKEVTPDQTLSFIVANIAPGTTVPVEYIRGGEHKALNITIGRRPSEEDLAAQSFNPDEEPDEPEPDDSGNLLEEVLGVRVRAIDPRTAVGLGMDSDAQGLVVLAVDPNSDAGRKGLSRGSVILQANSADIASIEDLEGIISAAQGAGREAVLLRVRSRTGQTGSVPVRLQEK